MNPHRLDDVVPIAIEMFVLLSVGIGFAETVRRHILGVRLERNLRAIPLPVRRD
jgi:hypothetical protein